MNHSRKICMGLVGMAGISFGVLAFAQDDDAQERIELPHRFEAGEKAMASEVNENFDVIAEVAAFHRFLIDENSAAIADMTSPSNLIRVDKAGSFFDSVATALDAIEDASADNPYVVSVGPGLYEETEPLRVGPYVHLKGCGAGTTIIRGDRSGSQQNGEAALVILEDLGQISDLTLHNQGNQDNYTVGLFSANASIDTILRDVEIDVDGEGGVGHFAVYFSNSNLRIEGCDFYATGANSANSVNAALGSIDDVGGFSQPRIRNTRLEGFGGFLATSIFARHFAADIQACTLKGQDRGLIVNVKGMVELQDCRIESGGPAMEQSGTATILCSTTTFIALEPIGDIGRYKYVHCVKSNYDPIENGYGSQVEP